MPQLPMQTKAATKMRTSSLRCFIFLVNNDIQQQCLIVRRAVSGKYETGLVDGNIWRKKIEFASC